MVLLLPFYLLLLQHQLLVHMEMPHWQLHCVNDEISRNNSNTGIKVLGALESMKVMD